MRRRLGTSASCARREPRRSVCRCRLGSTWRHRPAGELERACCMVGFHESGREVMAIVAPIGTAFCRAHPAPAHRAQPHGGESAAQHMAQQSSLRGQAHSNSI
eukprot:2810230-Prymnesium_polylepis.1